MYQGRTNYETYAVELWLQATEFSYNCIRLQYLDFLTKAGGDKEEATEQLARALEEKLNNEFPHFQQANVYEDLLQAAVNNVNWQEVAASFTE